jgi:hypothetical protein
MFAAALHLDEEDEPADGHHQHQAGEEEVVRLHFAAAPMIIKVKNCILVLGLAVAAFIQFSTLESRYLNALMWGEQGELEEHQYSLPAFLPNPFKTFQSMAAILMLVFLRAVIFPNCTQHATSLEAILADLVFQMQCRFVIGFLTCFTPVPFECIEAAVVVLSIALQTTTATVVQ